jgi:hypothetical protein
MRKVTITEHNRAAEARERMFGGARWSYLRSALHAAVMLSTAGEDYLARMDNRAWHARVRDHNVALYRATRAHGRVAARGVV